MAGPEFDTPVKVGVPNPRIVLDLSQGLVNFQPKSTGAVKVKDVKGNDLIVLNVDSRVDIPDEPSTARISILARNGNLVREVIRLRDDGSIHAGGGKNPDRTGMKGRNGKIFLYNESVINVGTDKAMVTVDGEFGELDLANKFHIWGSKGDLIIRDKHGTHSFGFHSGDKKIGAGLWIGGIKTDSPNNPDNSNLKSGYLAIRNSNGNDSMILDGNGSWMGLHDNAANRVFAAYSEGITWAGNPIAFTAVGKHKNDEPKEGRKAGVLVVRNPQGDDSIILDGTKGDIMLANADCAEEFDLSIGSVREPGTVMVFAKDGSVIESRSPYDKKVAGVISGGGKYSAGIVLDSQTSKNKRVALALMGKVYCKADADYSKIEAGDLLTTSSSPGYAMKAADPHKAFGAIIGKSLAPLSKGKRLLPILVSLQ